MNKKKYLITNMLCSALLCAGLFVTVTGCNKDSKNEITENFGTLSINVKTDTRIGNFIQMSSTRTSDNNTEDLLADEIPTNGEFELSLLQDKQEPRQLGKLKDFTTEKKIPVGNYEIEAHYGNIKEEGLNKPYFYGKTATVVHRGEQSKVTIATQLTNLKLSIESAPELKNYFKQISYKVHSSLNNEYTYGVNENQALFLHPGTIVVTAEFTKQNNKSSNVEIARIDNAEGGHHYRIQCNVNGGNVGEASLQIKFDDTVQKVTKDISLSDESLTVNPPKITAQGFTNNVSLNMTEGIIPSQLLTASIMASGVLSACDLKIESQFLQSKGIPATINLMANDANSKIYINQLLQMGMKMKGFDAKANHKMAWIDFTGLAKSLENSSNTATENTFSILATDKTGKVTEPLVLKLNVKSNGLNFTFNSTELPIDETSADAQITLVTPENIKGQDVINQMKMEYSDGENNWKPIAMKWVKDEENNIHHVKCSGFGNISSNLKFRLIIGNKTIEKTLNCKVPEYEVHIEDYDIWSNFCNFSITTTSADDMKRISKYLDIRCKDSKALGVKIDGNKLTGSFKNLISNTSYDLKAICANLKTVHKAFTTESEEQIPNGDFEGGTVNAPYYGKELVLGTRYTTIVTGLRHPGFYPITFEYTSPAKWCTVNEKTMPANATVKNTWNVVPSTITTKIEKRGYVASISNVQWDDNGEDVIQRDVFNAPKKNELDLPKKIKHRSAGRLFLGSYNYDFNHEKDTYNEGIDFKSRPKGVSFEYKYNAPLNNTEKGYIKVQVLHDTTVLAENYMELGATNEFVKNAIFLHYTVTNQKANKIAVMFCSSTKGKDLKQADEENIQLPTIAECKEEYKVVGATLYIDNVKLIY